MPPSNQTPPHLNTLRRDQARRRELSAALRRRQPHAIGTWLLLAVNTAIYVAMAIDAGGIRSFSSRLLIAWGALFAPEVANGEWWRLFTATFLHINALHLASNMLALAMGGPVVERLVGTRTFLAFYFASGLVGSAVGLATQREVTDVRPALLAAFSVDSQALSRYSGLVKSRMAPETIRRTIEEEIAPAFSRERAKLDSLGRVPPEQERTLADLRLYLSRREAYWRQRAAAVGRTDDARSLQLDDADRSADEVMRRLLATR